MGLAAVAFDLDYTLAVPDRDRATLLRGALEEAGAGSAASREEYLEAHGRHLTAETREPVFEALLEGTDADPGEVTAAYRRRVTDALVPVEGAGSLLEALRDSYRVGLLTNGPTVAQRAKIEALGWTDAFDAALITGDLPAGKPDPAAFRALLDALGTDAAETAYVGDDVEMDVAGAAEAGLVPVQVCFPGGPEPDPRAVALVERDRLATDLPDALASL
jgi:putative hydrolase of the HAD superfamily